MRVGTVLKDNRQHNKWEDIAFTGKGQGPLFFVAGLGPIRCTCQVHVMRKAHMIC